MRIVVLLIWVLLSILFSNPLLAIEPAARELQLEQAQKVFESAATPADYRRCAQLIEQVLEPDFRNGTVYYNLGNAWFRAGEMGRAISAYRKAKPFLPRDQYLDANLKQALDRAPGRLELPTAPWWKQVVFWHDWLSFPEKSYACIVLIASSAVLMAVWIWFRFRAARVATAVTLLFVVPFVLDYWLTRQEVVFNDRAVIVMETVARKGIGESYEPAFDQPLKDGAEFTVLQHSGDWILGHFAGAGDGWIPRQAVSH